MTYSVSYVRHRAKTQCYTILWRGDVDDRQRRHQVLQIYSKLLLYGTDTFLRGNTHHCAIQHFSKLLYHDDVTTPYKNPVSYCFTVTPPLR